MIVKKIYHQGEEVNKILDSYGNIVFQKTAEMTNDIKFHTKSSVNSVNYFTVYYTDSTQKDMKYSEPNKEYVFPIPTDKTVRMINFGTSNIDEVTVSCKIKLSSDLFNSKPSTIRLLSCDSTKSTNLINSFRYMVSPQNLVEIRNLDARNATGMTSLFTDSYGIKQIVMRDLNVSKVTDMSYMFNKCSGATTIDISNWNTSSVTNLSNAFSYCKQVDYIDLSSWTTSNVIDMSYMFSYCTSLTSLDVSHFNTAKVRNMSYMFGSCEKLASLDVRHFNTSNVTNMGCMFSRCPKLASLDLSGWNTAKVTDMSNMFMLCQAKSLDLSGWNMESVKSANSMFFRCNSLTIVRMVGCNQTTIDKIKSALSSDGILSHVKIITE